MVVVWYDDQVWSNYFNLSSPEQAAIIYHKLSTDGADEQVCWLAAAMHLIPMFVGMMMH